MLTAKPLDVLTHIRHGFFTREGGVSKGIYASLNCGYGSDDDTENVRENRARIAEKLSVEREKLLTVYQIHSPTVALLRNLDARYSAAGDAMVTATPGIALGILTADCAPVLFADKKARHRRRPCLGWKAQITGVLDHRGHARPRRGGGNIAAAIGPSSQRGLRSRPEFHERFSEDANARWFEPSDNPGHFVRPAGYVASASKRPISTVAARPLHLSGRRFFLPPTHRKEKDYGRQCPHHASPLTTRRPDRDKPYRVHPASWAGAGRLHVQWNKPTQSGKRRTRDPPSARLRRHCAAGAASIGGTAAATRQGRDRPARCCPADARSFHLSDAGNIARRAPFVGGALGVAKAATAPIIAVIDIADEKGQPPTASSAKRRSAAALDGRALRRCRRDRGQDRAVVCRLVARPRSRPRQRPAANDAPHRQHPCPSGTRLHRHIYTGEAHRPHPRLDTELARAKTPAHCPNFIIEGSIATACAAMAATSRSIG